MNDVNNKNNGQPGQDNNPNGGKGGPNRKRNFIMLGISLAIFFFLMWSSTSMLSNSSHEEITYSQFVEMVDAGEVEEVIIEEEILYITEGRGRKTAKLHGCAYAVLWWRQPGKGLYNGHDGRLQCLISQIDCSGCYL